MESEAKKLKKDLDKLEERIEKIQERIKELQLERVACANKMAWASDADYAKLSEQMANIWQEMETFPNAMGGLVRNKIMTDLAYLQALYAEKDRELVEIEKKVKEAADLQRDYRRQQNDLTAASRKGGISKEEAHKRLVEIAAKSSKLASEAEPTVIKRNKIEMARSVCLLQARNRYGVDLQKMRRPELWEPYARRLAQEAAKKLRDEINYNRHAMTV